MTQPHSLANLTAAAEIMLDFSARTGLSSEKPVRRYLWTDAFALCNFLTLYQATQEAQYKDLALALIAQVHDILGHHRPDDPRKGWISGLSKEEGRAHPVAGGLRIGKPLPEREPDAPFDPQLEWERDGQYYHYLTKWMHALAQAGCILGNAQFTQWATELAQVANRAFVYRARDGSTRMHWKMRIDLSAPLVASMGQHDPLDGLVTCLALERAAQLCAPDQTANRLDDEIALLAQIAQGQALETDDPLGLGGLMFDAGRLLLIASDSPLVPQGLTNRVLQAALTGCDQYLHQNSLNMPPAQRLAFRELGLAIGLSLPACLPTANETATDLSLHQIEALTHYQPVHDYIIKTWRAPQNQRLESWLAHQDINSVMLATSLAPETFLILATPTPSEDA